MRLTPCFLDPIFVVFGIRESYVKGCVCSGRRVRKQYGGKVVLEDHPWVAASGGSSSPPVVLSIFLNGGQRDPCLGNLTRLSVALAGTADRGLKTRVPAVQIL